MRLFAPVLACAFLSGACTAEPQPDMLPTDRGAPTAITPSGPTCPESDVVVRTGVADAAMGVRALGVELTNCGTAVYEVNGYPDVRVLDENRQPLQVQVTNGEEPDDHTPAPVVLQPGDSAVARLFWRNTVTRSDVNAVNGTFVEIVPANGQAPQTVRPEAPIDLGNTGTINVSAWYVP